MSDKVSKALSASAKSLSESRECIIEVYIDNRCIIVVVYSISFRTRLFIVKSLEIGDERECDTEQDI